MPANPQEFRRVGQDGAEMTEPLLLPLDEATQLPSPRETGIRVIRSALWAAWGDAVGFPTELARDTADLERRFGQTAIDTPLPWNRRIGGRKGPTVELPAGTYSDDTQLRLAVCRCLRSNGRFDTEAFSKIELPVFLSYQLGAGRGTKAAAKALSKRSGRWNGNFFADSGSVYVNGGGNGAAMRIQPHVWAARDHRAPAYLSNLLRDAVTTHGHPRGILGAVWHALALGSALREGKIPAPDSWPSMIKALRPVIARIKEDPALGAEWVPRWGEVAGRQFSEVAEETVRECEDLAGKAIVASDANAPLDERYKDLAGALGGLASETRGSGTVSAALSLWLAWECRDDPVTGLRVAANLLGSDTDTVATLAGALLGAAADSDPPSDLQDRALHQREAERLVRLGAGGRVADFPHPDPLRWQPPATLGDAVGLDASGRIHVAGLGAGDEIGLPNPSKGREDAAWQWLRMAFGQDLLVKRRQKLKALPSSALPHERETRPAPRPGEPQVQKLPRREALPHNIDDALRIVVRSRFDDELIGRIIKHFSSQRHGEEKAGVFGALVARSIRDTRSELGRAPRRQS